MWYRKLLLKEILAERCVVMEERGYTANSTVLWILTRLSKGYVLNYIWHHYCHVFTASLSKLKLHINALLSYRVASLWQTTPVSVITSLSLNSKWTFPWNTKWQRIIWKHHIMQLAITFLKHLIILTRMCPAFILFMTSISCNSRNCYIPSRGSLKQG